MSDLTSFRDHARLMSTADHKPDECKAIVQESRYYSRTQRPDPDCPGCVTDADRALWIRLADEVDAYLTHDDEGLFA